LSFDLSNQHIGIFQTYLTNFEKKILKFQNRETYFFEKSSNKTVFNKFQLIKVFSKKVSKLKK